MIGAYQVSDRPGRWLMVIAPDDTLEFLERELRAIFGQRLLAVQDAADPRSVEPAPGAPAEAP